MLNGDVLNYPDAKMWEDDDAIHIEFDGDTVHILHHSILTVETVQS